ncbi:MAG: chemotaxis response regulator protein-glutamate methylesterase, partial [Gammaproteobacteria bacterium]|nr:chemotaxis response regulator protein-glutamate methylesterase [Gammaproteobacteria bacterium]
GTASDGREAILKAGELKPDVITMDIEMPVMDGITATRRIMALHRTPIIMFSSLTQEGAQATLDALEAGALDFLPKKFEDISKDRDEAKRQLCNKVKAVARGGRTAAASSRPRPAAPSTSASASTSTGVAAARSTAPAPATTSPSKIAKVNVDLVAIGTSTGGPVALQKVLTQIPASYPHPIILVQHMPASFTPAFAQRLNGLCQITVKEAKDGDPLEPGTALLAPGGKQMSVEKVAGRSKVRIFDGPESQHYRPCVDISFESVAKVYPGRALGIILTGMGADGREGCRAMKQTGCKIWSQDEASCVVYGMPAAVAEAGISDQVLTLTDVGPAIVRST